MPGGFTYNVPDGVNSGGGFGRVGSRPGGSFGRPHPGGGVKVIGGGV